MCYPISVFAASWISPTADRASVAAAGVDCIRSVAVCVKFNAPRGSRDAINQAGFPTTVTLDSGKPTTINFIEGAVGIPEGFQNVKTVKFGDKKVTFVSTTGKEVVANVSYDFLTTGKL
jgi:hypothetical protein